MQAWDQVQVKADGQYNGQAGLVIRTDAAKQVATVKLDGGDVQAFAFAELTLLGR